MSEWREYREIEEIERALNEANDRLNSIEAAIADQSAKLDQILQVLVPTEVPATGFTFENTGDNAMPTNFTVTPGQPFQVTASTIPTGASLQAGAIPVWSVDDASVTLVADATGLVVNGTTLATDTAPSFNLTLTGINSAGAKISNTQNMAFTAAPPAPATGFSFVQNS
jgi:hypothetical protein